MRLTHLLPLSPRPQRTLLAAAVATALLGGCGDDDPATIQGVFLDSAVSGLEYVIGSTSATTGSDGGFSCKEGETLSFRIGDVVLGSAPCASVITPLTLAKTSDVTSAAVVNRVLTLQLLDEDNDPSNGISLSAAVRSALKGQNLNFSADSATFDAALTNLLALESLPASVKGRTLNADSRTLAAEHFEDTLARINQRASTSLAQSSPAGTVTVTISRMNLQAADALYIPYEPVTGSPAATATDFPKGFWPAYGSGLAYKGKSSTGALEFYAITDRGPNGDGPSAPVPGVADATSTSKVFPAPSFTPSIGLITVGSNGAVLSNPLPIKATASQKISGLPLQPGSVGSSGEVPLTDTYKYLGKYDANGLDPESLVYDQANNAFWLSDEYGPFIAKVNASSGVIDKKYAPGTGLPAVLASRRANRGMEGMTLADGKLHGFLQSPLDPKDSEGKSIKATPPGGSKADVRHIAKFIRWVEFNPSTENTKLYAYPVDGSLYDKDRTGNAKLGDVTALGNGKFLVIEQGARKSDGKVQNWLMLVEIPTNATNIASLDHNLEISSITQAVSGSADYSTVVPLKKTKLLDLNAAGWLAEKAEGLTLVDANTIALINDNDFGLRTILLDASGNTVEGSVEDCAANAAGQLSCEDNSAVTSARLTRAVTTERATRLWLIRFAQPLASYSVPSAN